MGRRPGGGRQTGGGQKWAAGEGRDFGRVRVMKAAGGQDDGRRRCVVCRRWFVPDRRNAGRQKFCSEERCQQVRRLRSMAAWRLKPENRDHWQGSSEVERVRQWRREHPGYWRRCKSGRGEKGAEGTLRNVCGRREGRWTQGRIKVQGGTLQNDWMPQDPLLVGLVATLVGRTLQNDIAEACRIMVAKGWGILANRRGVSAVRSDRGDGPGRRPKA